MHDGIDNIDRGTQAHKFLSFRYILCLLATVLSQEEERLIHLHNSQERHLQSGQQHLLSCGHKLQHFYHISTCQK